MGKLSSSNSMLGSSVDDDDKPVLPPPKPKPKGNSSRLQRIGIQVPLVGPEDEQKVFSRH